MTQTGKSPAMANRLFSLMVLAALLLAGLGTGAAAAQTGDAVFSEIQGQVQARPDADSTFGTVQNGATLSAGGQAQTGEDGRARLTLSDGSIVRMAEDTAFQLDESEEGINGLLHRLQLEFGQLWIILSGQALEVDTPSGVASVRGSYMSVFYDPETGLLYITCLEGECTLTSCPEGGCTPSNPGVTVTITEGQSATIAGLGEAPVAGVMTPEDFEAWLEYNPEAGLIILQLTPTPPAGPGGGGGGASGSPAWPLANNGQGTTPKPQRVTSSGGCNGLNTLTGRVQVCSASAGTILSAAPLDSGWLNRLPELGEGLSFAGEGLTWWADPDPGVLTALICFPRLYPDETMAIYSLTAQGYWVIYPTTVMQLANNGVDFVCTQGGPGTYAPVVIID